MKKTLLIALVLSLSAITAHAQGFRVYRSDGTIYQFRWATDSIAFFEDEGDPDWKEPIPEEVERAITTLQTNVVALQARVEDSTNRLMNLQASVENNTERVYALQAMVSALQEDNVNLQTRVENDEQAIQVLQYRNEALQTRVAEGETVLVDLMNIISSLEARVRSLEELSEH